jgi:very-short-patch-repair endonuclease
MFYYILGIIIILAVVLKIFETFFKESKSKVDLSVFERKPYLFDTNSEFNLYKVLLELFGDKYFIFPQINYSHLIQPKRASYTEERRQRSRIDRKSADFVFCDKINVIPRLIIELDGSMHNFKSKQARDEFIDELTKIVDLPILHLKTSNLDREFIKNEINAKLNKPIL